MCVRTYVVKEEAHFGEAVVELNIKKINVVPNSIENPTDLQQTYTAIYQTLNAVYLNLAVPPSQLSHSFPESENHATYY